MADRVMIKLDEPEESTTGGLILVNNIVDTHDQGTVIAVGPGKLSKTGVVIEPEVKEGDRVIIPKGIGTPVKLRGQEGIIVKEEDILGIID